jgi:head-tail adaptor
MALMTATVTSTLPDSIQVQRKGRVADGAGGYTETWTTLSTVVARVDPMQERVAESLYAERVSSHKRWMIVMPLGTDVVEKDRLVFKGQTIQVDRVLSKASIEVCIMVAGVSEA